MSTNEIIESSLELPIEQRVILADLLTQSLNQVDKEVEAKWIEEVKRRVQLLEEGSFETISFNEFFGEN